MKTNKKVLNCEGKPLECMFRKSKKAKRLRLTVHCDGRVIATIPSVFPYRSAEEFVIDKSRWIFSKIEEFNKRGESLLYRGSDQEFKAMKEQARTHITERIKYFNQFYSFNIGRVFIRNQKTRWGSCSSSGNLNFNYKLMFLSQEFIDYVIIHEICHLKEMNHSDRFWALVGKLVPNYRQLAREIRKM